MANKRKDWLLSGVCVLPNGETIHFFGQTNAVSPSQAHFNLCWDIKRCFNIDEMVNPILSLCTVFTSSNHIMRRVTPSNIKYFKDIERKQEIVVKRRASQCASSIYGEEGEEIIDFNISQSL